MLTTGVDCRFAFQNRRGVGCDFFRRESGASRHAGIDLKSDGRSADGIFDSVQHIDHALDLADRLGNLRRPASSNAGSCENSLIWTGSGSLVRSPIMSCSTCTNSTRTAGSWAAHFCSHIFDYVVDAAAAIFFQFYQDVAAVGFRDRRQSQFQAGPPGSALNFRNSIQYLLAGAGRPLPSLESVWKPQVIAAMTSLGWSEKDAAASIDKVPLPPPPPAASPSARSTILTDAWCIVLHRHCHRCCGAGCA